MPGVQNQALTDLIAQAMPSLIELRHDLHVHPQVAYEETYAAGQVSERLKSLGIEHVTGVGETGVVGWIMPTDEAAKHRPAVALRADMDALPIHEETGLPYASQTPGKMHACGHDGHTTILIGAATVLSKLRDQLPCPVKLLFQPAEEGGAGAAKLIDAGALDQRIGGVAVASAFGLHGWPAMKLGTVASKPNAIMASTDLFHITIQGQGSHGAAPHLSADPILAAGQIVTALQSIVSRNIDPTEPAVVSVCKLRAGDALNVIPMTSYLGGTVRVFSETTATQIHERIQQIAQQVASALGCEAEVTIERGYPPTINDPAATAYVLKIARSALGDAQVIEWDRPSMVAEDFAFYGQNVQAAFYYLGLCPTDQQTYPGLHTPTFDFNDDALPVGIRMMCELALHADDLNP